MSDVTRAREALCRIGQRLERRGLAHGAAGNLSLRLAEGGWLVTPTGTALGELDPATLAWLDERGRLVSGDPPTKEVPLHLAIYGARSRETAAVVHLHCTHAVAVSTLEHLDPLAALPPITAYAVMRVGRLALVPYHPPGDAELAAAVAPLAGRHHALLLANHGPIVAGRSLEDACFAMEELEETARLFLLLQGKATAFLSPAEVAELERRFPS